MGGYIRIDKEQATDQRLFDIADDLAGNWRVSDGNDDLGSNDLRHALRNALLGVTVTLWAYADTHINSDDSLRVTLDGLAAIVGAPVTWLEALPPEWLRVRDDGNVELPGYCAKNHIHARDLRRDDRSARREHERELAAERQRRKRAKDRGDGHGVTSLKKRRDSHAVTAPTGPGPGPLDPTRDPDPVSAPLAADPERAAAARGKLRELAAQMRMPGSVAGRLKT